MTLATAAGRASLLAVVLSWLGIGLAAAQPDLAKTLVGTWRGEIQGRFKKGAEATCSPRTPCPGR